MAQPETYSEPDYSAIDPVLLDWTQKHGIRLDRDYKGYIVRSIWWREKIQIWLDPPDSENYLMINSAERRPDLPSQWGRRLKLRVPMNELANALDSAWSILQDWAAK